MAGAGAESDASLGVRTILRADRDWGGAGLSWRSSRCRRLRVVRPCRYRRVAAVWSTVGAILGFSGSAEGRSAFFVGKRAHEPVLRSSWRLEASRCSITGVARSFGRMLRSQRLSVMGA